MSRYLYSPISSSSYRNSHQDTFLIWNSCPSSRGPSAQELSGHESCYGGAGVQAEQGFIKGLCESLLRHRNRHRGLRKATMGG